MKVVNYLDIIGVDVGSTPCVFSRASTTAQGLYPAPSIDSAFHLTSQILTNKCDGNGMMTDPYPHLQHVKVMNSLL